MAARSSSSTLVLGVELLEVELELEVVQVGLGGQLVGLRRDRYLAGGRAIGGRGCRSGYGYGFGLVVFLFDLDLEIDRRLGLDPGEVFPVEGRIEDRVDLERGNVALGRLVS
jgi:hypothetical protein